MKHYFVYILSNNNKLCMLDLQIFWQEESMNISLPLLMDLLKSIMLTDLFITRRTQP